MISFQDIKSKCTPKVPKKALSSIFRAYMMFVMVGFLLVVIRQKTYSGDPLIFMIPNFFMGLTPFIYTAARMWNYIIDYESLPIREKQHITELLPNADGNLDFEKLRLATNNFLEPAVVRGLFSDTIATEKWTKHGYLEHRLSNMSMIIMQNGKAERDFNEDVYMNMGEAAKCIVEDRTCTKQIFFPNEARTPEMIPTVKNLTLNDLEVERKLWKGFGTESHKGFLWPQMLISNGFNEKATTGTFWHCEYGNNWFVQVAGRKRWYLLSPRYSAYMKPGRKGKPVIRSPIDIIKYEKYLPIQYVDLRAGDMLYNPEWWWHRIENYDGLSIGIPFRCQNLIDLFRNNFQYTSITLINILMIRVTGYGFPMWGTDIRGIGEK